MRKYIVLPALAATVSAAAAYYAYSRKSKTQARCSPATKEMVDNTSSLSEQESSSLSLQQSSTSVECSSKYAQRSDSLVAPVDSSFSWAEEVHRADEVNHLSEELKAKVALNSECSCDGDASQSSSADAMPYGCLAEEEVRRVMAVSTQPTGASANCSKGSVHTGSSPSVASESSNDSGKGGSSAACSGMSPVEELIEVPPMYEFEIPQDIVGLLIGRKGINIKWLMQESGAHMVIRDHFNVESTFKICSIEGPRESINKCLRLIRRKFPVSQFPALKLTPLLPPPVTSPHTPVWDSIVQLSLPEGVSCEVILSSMVTAGHFFLQQPTHPTYPSLAKLDQYMLAVYSQPLGVPALPRPIDTGVVCAAPVLGGWYRAQTLNYYDETDEVLVKFVDYGGYSKLPASDLKQIRSDFMTLPFQANECYLAHVKPINEEQGWSVEAFAFLEVMTLGKVVEAVTVGIAEDGLAMVELFTPVDDVTVLLNQAMVDEGHAEWIA